MSENSLSLALVTTKWLNYIRTPTGMALMVATTSDTYVQANATFRYLHRDHLGSTTLITDETGAVTERLTYNAWGKRRAGPG